MNKSNHTPGPWLTQAAAERCLFMDRDHNGINTDMFSTIGMANVNLIAAAPDMLATLKYLQDNITHAYLDTMEMENMENIINAAISKATGGAE